MRLFSRFLAAGCALAGLLAGSSASAQPGPAYPAKPIRIIAAIPPGSPPDIVARVLSERLAATFGQPVVVENRPGASGTIGMNVLAKSAPDGYSFGVMSMPYTITPSLLLSVPYDTAKDLVAVRQVVWSGNILVVQGSSPFRSVEELVAAAKAKPGELTFASGGNATPAHLSGEFLRYRSGTQLRHIPYKGAPEGIAALMGGQVTMMFAAAVAVAPHLKTGKLRALAVSTPARIAGFPEIPTMIELGFADFDIRDWQGIVAPAGTPPGILARMASEIDKITAAPEVKKRFASLGMEAVDRSSPEEFGALIRSEMARWAKFVRDAGIHID